MSQSDAVLEGTTAPMTRRQVLEALSGLLLGMFVSMLASTVVSTSLPVIVHDLDGGQAAYTWVVTATLLTTAISTPIWGKLADLVNRKLLFQLSISIFVLATAAAGFSHDPGMLIACRAVQGLGAGGLAALAQVLMADIISPRERGRYMGLMGAVMAVATVGGPLLGGVITDAFGWRWNFFIALPLAVAALVLVQKTLHVPDYAKKKTKIDYVGIVLLAAAVGLMLIWVTNAGTDYAWWSETTLFMVGGALIAGILFVIIELRSDEPLLPLSLFRGRTFTLAVLASISTGVAMFGAAVYLAQYMQLARGATPTKAGVMTIPMILGLLLTSAIVGQLISKFGVWKPYLIGGAISLIAGSYMLSTIHYDTNFALVSLYMFLLGAGVGATMQNLVLIVQNSANANEMGVATSGVTFFRTFGGTIGVSVMGAALATKIGDLFVERSGELQAAIMGLGDKAQYWADQLSSGAVPKVSAMPDGLRVIIEDMYAQGISHAFLIGVPFAVLALIAIAFLPNVPLHRMTTQQRLQSAPASGADAPGIPVTIVDPNSTADATSSGRADASVSGANEEPGELAGTTSPR